MMQDSHKLVALRLRCIGGTYTGANTAVVPSQAWTPERYDQKLCPTMNTHHYEDHIPRIQSMLKAQIQQIQGSGIRTMPLNQLKMTVDQLLYGVSDLNSSDKASIKLILIKHGLINKDGRFKIEDYEGKRNDIFRDIDREFRIEKDQQVVKSVIAGISSNASDAIYFANMFMYLGHSSTFNRPVYLTPTFKHGARQIERYFNIVAGMKLGAVLVQCSDGEKPLVHESMADHIPITAKDGRKLMLCFDSTRSSMDAYKELRKIKIRLGIEEEIDDYVPLSVRTNVYDVSETNKSKVDVEPGTKTNEFIYHSDLAYHVALNEYGDEVLYLGDGILTPEAEAKITGLVGEDRIVKIPKEEWELYCMNTVILDERFGASKKTAIMRDDCPVMKGHLEKHGYNVIVGKEEFPEGGGSTRCRLDLVRTDTSYDKDEYHRQQDEVARLLGKGYALEPNKEDKATLDQIFDPLHLIEITKKTQTFTAHL